MYVKTDKATIKERIKEIEDLKAENKRLEDLLTKWKDNRIKILIKSEREWRKQNKELIKQNRELIEENTKLKNLLYDLSK